MESAPGNPGSCVSEFDSTRSSLDAPWVRGPREFLICSFEVREGRMCWL